MVSPELRKQFAKRGIELISPSDGRRGMDRELCYGRKGEVEVLLTAGGWGTPVWSESATEKQEALTLKHSSAPSAEHGSLRADR
jgi:hypothetical protein